MPPLFFSLSTRLQLMVIPNSGPHLNEQTSPSTTYAVFLDMALRDPRQSKVKESALQPERLADPDYCGYLSLKNNRSSFTYTPNGKKELSSDEVEQLVEQING